MAQSGILPLFVILLTSLSASAQQVDRNFQKYLNVNLEATVLDS